MSLNITRCMGDEYVCVLCKIFDTAHLLMIGWFTAVIYEVCVCVCVCVCVTVCVFMCVHVNV